MYSWWNEWHYPGLAPDLAHIRRCDLFSITSRFSPRGLFQSWIWPNELHTCSEKWWTQWDSQASEFNIDFKETLIIFCQRRSAIYLQCIYITFHCSDPFRTLRRPHINRINRYLLPIDNSDVTWEIIHEVSLNDYFSQLRITEINQNSNLIKNDLRHKINTHNTNSSQGR